MEPKLTKQSEAILSKLSDEVKSHRGKNPLTEEEIAKIRSAFTLYEGFGKMGGLAAKVAGFVLTILTIFSLLPLWWKK